MWSFCRFLNTGYDDNLWVTDLFENLIKASDSVSQKNKITYTCSQFCILFFYFVVLRFDITHGLYSLTQWFSDCGPQNPGDP